MMDWKRQMAMVVAAALALPLVAAPAVTVKNTFRRQPAEAATALKRVIGKPISTGYVFIDGKYIPPPYKVERNGLVIRVNNMQVTNPIVPWEEFVKTQEGVTVTKTEVGGGAPAEAAPEPEPEPEEENLDDWDDDDSASSLDDLFDDDPKPKAAKKKPAAKRKPPKPKVKKPTVQVTYSFTGEFRHNEKTEALLAKINAERTRIDARLRAGGFCFFGSAYAAGVSGDATLAKQMIAKLPEAMKANNSAAGFAAAARQAGLVYLTPALANDLFKNRVDYLQLMQRRKAESEKSPWNNLLGP